MDTFPTPTPARASQPCADGGGHLRALVAGLPFAVMEFVHAPQDGTPLLLAANPAADALLGRACAASVGQPLAAFFAPHALAALAKLIYMARHTGAPQARRHVCREDGQIMLAWDMWVYTTAPDRVAANLRDVTRETQMRAHSEFSALALAQSNARLQEQLALYSTMERVAQIGHWTRRLHEPLAHWSPGLFRIAGMVPQATMDHATAILGLPAEDRPRFKAACDRADGTPFDHDWNHPDGRQRRIRCSIQRVGPPHDMEIGVVQDITEAHHIGVQLRDQLALIQQIASRLPGYIFQYRSRPGEKGRFLYLSDAVQDMLGLAPQDIERDKRHLLARIHADDLPRVLASSELSRAQLLPWQCEYRVNLPDGSVRWHLSNAAPRLEADGAVLSHGFSMDVTDRKQAEEDIQRLAFYDALTGLPNRRLLTDRLQHAVAACVRGGYHGALLFIDLDNFKDLNDTLGHDMGDRQLTQVAERLLACVRDNDTVARLGGDEFVVLLHELGGDAHTAAQQAERVGLKLLATLNEPFVLVGQPHYSTPSIGITLFGAQRERTDEIFKRADLAMYQAKAAGRNTQRFFDPAMQAAASARAALEADLRQGMARGEIVAYYQPVVDAEGRIRGAEALARWRHPQRGLVLPGEFIAIAEQSSLILELSQQVLEAACAQLVRWAADSATRTLGIAVNVSARTFRQPDFADGVLAALQASGAHPGLLRLELTESMLLGDVEDAIGKMRRLKDHGVGFSLDDFGTGYSSLGYLQRLPLDELKIDRSFVRGLPSNANDAAIVRTILTLARSLGLRAVAEGVETSAQRDFLRAHGCDAFQGYLFGRPVPAEELPVQHP